MTATESAGGKSEQITPEESRKMIVSITGMTPEYMTRNQGKPYPCRLCKKDFEPNFESWGSGEDWDVCILCGFDRVKKEFGTPKEFFDADINVQFAYDLSIQETLLTQSLYIYGPTGTGKTFLACAIAHQHLKLKRYPHGLFVEFHDLVKKLQGTFKPPRYLSESQILSPYVHAPVLILDDIFGTKEHDKPTEAENRVLYEITKERKHSGMMTIITSNYDFEQLEKKGFNARSTSRMAGLCQSMNLDGVDRRLTLHAPPAN